MLSSTHTVAVDADEKEFAADDDKPREVGDSGERLPVCLTCSIQLRFIESTWTLWCSDSNENRNT